MSGLEVAALAMVAIWLALLSLAVLLCVRQIAILELRLQGLPAGFSFADDGLAVGADVPAEVEKVVPELFEADPFYVLVASAGCIPCREVIADMRNRDLPRRFATLLSGSDDVAESLITQLPSRVKVIRDPDATATAKLLEIESTPFCDENYGWGCRREELSVHLGRAL